MRTRGSLCTIGDRLLLCELQRVNGHPENEGICAVAVLPVVVALLKACEFNPLAVERSRNPARTFPQIPPQVPLTQVTDQDHDGGEGAKAGAVLLRVDDVLEVLIDEAAFVRAAIGPMLEHLLQVGERTRKADRHRAHGPRQCR